MLPEDKARIVRTYKERGEIVAMARDGINDAPALATAHVGIAMGSGTDIAIQSAGVTLVKGDLRGIVRSLRLGQATMRNIRENLGLAFGYNLLAIPVAAGVLAGRRLSSAMGAPDVRRSASSVVSTRQLLQRAQALPGPG